MAVGVRRTGLGTPGAGVRSGSARVRASRCRTSRVCAELERRPFLVGAGTAAGAIMGCVSSSGQAAGLVEESIPRAEACPGLNISRIVKGCWQLSGGHRGDRASDRTNGKSAVKDFEAFVEAGITTFDTADIYGPSEELIGKYLDSRGGSDGVQVFTKLCYFGSDMNFITDKQVAKRIKASAMKLKMDKVRHTPRRPRDLPPVADAILLLLASSPSRLSIDQARPGSAVLARLLYQQLRGRHEGLVQLRPSQERRRDEHGRQTTWRDGRSWSAPGLEPNSVQFAGSQAGERDD